MQNRIREERKKAGKSIDDVARAIGVSRGTANNYETGKHEPKLETWQKMADYFGVPVPYLQGFSDPSNNVLHVYPDTHGERLEQLLGWFSQKTVPNKTKEILKTDDVIKKEKIVSDKITDILDSIYTSYETLYDLHADDLARVSDRYAERLSLARDILKMKDDEFKELKDKIN